MRAKLSARTRTFVELDEFEHAEILAFLRTYSKIRRPWVACYLVREGLSMGNEPKQQLPRPKRPVRIILSFSPVSFPALHKSYLGNSWSTRRDAFAQYLIRGARRVLAEGGEICSIRYNEALTLPIGHRYEPPQPVPRPPDAPALGKTEGAHVATPATTPAPERAGLKNILASLEEICETQ